MTTRRRDVFVIMPFSDTASCTESEWTEIFEQVFRPAIDACGYTCERASPGTGSLIASIVERLNTARTSGTVGDWLATTDSTRTADVLPA
jgi:hypothetical protein